MPDNETRFYELGGLGVRIDCPPFEETSYMSPFRCAPREAELDYTVRVVKEPVLHGTTLLYRGSFEEIYDAPIGRTRAVFAHGTGNKSSLLFADEDKGGGRHNVYFAERYLKYLGTNAVLSMLDIPRRLAACGGVVLHAAYVDVGGRAILFTAPKQTGKSTQAHLWERHRGAFVVNGDRAALRKTDGVWHACGLPYCGTSRVCHNRTLPVCALVILSQAHACTARPALAREAVAALLNGATYDVWDDAQVKKVLCAAEDIFGSLSVLHLACTPDISAVAALEQALARI